MILYLFMYLYDVYSRYKNIIKMLGFPYATILIFTAYGPILRRLMSIDRMNLMSSFFLFVLVVSMIIRPGVVCPGDRKRRFLMGAVILSALTLLPFALYPYWFQWVIVGILAFTEGRIASIWSRYFLKEVPAGERGLVVGITLFISYGFLYLTNMLFIQLPPSLLPVIASGLLIISIPSQFKLLKDIECLGRWEGETGKIGSKSTLGVFFILYISAGVTFSGIFPELVKAGRIYQFINVLPFVLAIPFIGFLADRKGRPLLLFLGTGCLGLSFITYLFPKGTLQYILTEIPLEVGWAFLDAAVWIIGADMAERYRNTQIQMYSVAAFLSGTFIGSLIYLVLMQFWGEHTFIILVMAHVPLFIGIFVLGMVNTGRKLDFHPEVEAESQNDAEILTPREKEILDILLEGLSNKEICYRLNISPNTLKTHIRRVYRKSGVSTRSELQSKYLTVGE